ncbi:ATP-dependent RNA helicase HrpA [Micrococcoides hystricis]|uniref:RNA helicase n=1 Tax=Micrococcoides hystricis TaxID=1572761 RepID=A0ABV6PBR3_9MICC
MSEISFPPQLPVSARRTEIMAAIAANQVVVIAGETGSGKTTQIPKMCLALGLADKGLIGHTQPRRLAARTVAERIAEELGQDLGGQVGYQVRFTAETSADTKIKLMTDGILLAEIQHDPLLKRYSTLIIDEAHERSLNIDFLLGYLKRILPRRPDLKIIITSATIDPERFARHFAVDPEDEKTQPPIIEVSGRTYPVEIRYRPLTQLRPADDPFDDADDEEDARDPLDAVADAVLELADEAPGDMLIFFSGEREIRDAADALTALIPKHRKLAGTEVLPLYARLSMAEQTRVFRPTGKRRIVLATNVAETSLTVPGIKYVIDTGTARISRYSHRTKVQRLPIERISQASALQRSGRCGRTSDGIAIRLYSEEDFQSRPEFTDPEILRTNLASVILSMAAIGVIKTPTEISDFPFVQPPDPRAIKDGVTLLTELGALATGRRRGTITRLGRKLAQLPVDPRLGRMILEAGRRGAAKEVMILAAALTIQDPRERPTEKAAQADELHKRFVDENSDFSGLLNLWRYLRTTQNELSGNQFRRRCQREFINYLRVREWQDLFQQLRQLAKPLGIKITPGPADPVGLHEPIHISLLSGLLTNLGVYDERRREYQGARNTRFSVFPGSALFKKRHDWIMAAELVETSRLWARTCAAIEPEWVESLAPGLLKHSYSEPHWSASAGSLIAYEKVTLFGLPIIAERRVLYGKIDPELSRELFIRHGLVDGDWWTHHKFFHRNRQRLQEVERLQTRLRRHDLLVDDQTLFDFYAARLPADITNERDFDKWWKTKQRQDPTLLDFDPDQLLAADKTTLDTKAFPTTFIHGNLTLKLEYRYNPVAEHTEADGITVIVPILFLNQLDPDRFTWLVPGLREDLLTALIRSLPKPLRKQCVPAPDVARSVLAELERDYDPLTDNLLESVIAILRRNRGVVIKPEDFDTAALPPYLKMGFKVVDRQSRNRQRVLGMGEDLVLLQNQLASENQAAIAAELGTTASGSGQSEGKNAAGKPAPRGARGPKPGALTQAQPRQNQPVTQFPDVDFGAQLSQQVAGEQVRGFPGLALHPDGTIVQSIYPNKPARDHGHRAAVLALLEKQLPNVQRYLLDHLKPAEKLIFTQNPHGSVAELVADCTRAATDQLLTGLPLTKKEYDAAFEHIRAELIETALRITELVAKILTLANNVSKDLKKKATLSLVNPFRDMRSQLDSLIYPGFVAATGAGQLSELPRYLQGMLTRIERLTTVGAVGQDQQNAAEVHKLEEALSAATDQLSARGVNPQVLEPVRWLLQELRVSLFAQQLGTAVSVSPKRVRARLRELTDQAGA